MKKMKLLAMFLLSSICFISCRNNNQNKKTVDSSENAITNTGINAENFKGMIGQDSVRLYTLSNRNGLKITFSNYGQRLVSLYAPDINGKFEDVVLGFPTLKEYTEKRNFYGATVGRYGNRIGKAKFSIGDEEYNLAVNNGENHLHGGNTGFDAVVWKVDGHTDHEIVFSRVSPDMEEGYPGNLSVQVKYELNDDNELKISYSAETDKTTVVNLTHHSFFNLKGEGNGDVIDHVVMINADRYTPVDPGLIPTGSIEAVKGTPFDFKEPKPIGKDIEADNEQLIRGKGYDHNFVLNDSPKNADGLVLAAKVVEPLSGRTMEVYTDEPGVQFYTGNFMDGKDIGKSGKTYGYRGAFCFETQHFPDSPNIPDFPSTLLKPGETYVSTCVYKFGTVK